MSTDRVDARVKSMTTRFDGFLTINEYEIDMDTHAGGTLTVKRLVMERGHAVGVLGYDAARDEVVLANELRPGMLAAGEYPFGDALVAGGIAADETAIEAAVREMKEEANLDLRDPVLVHPGAYVSPGGTSEKIALVFGHVDTSAAGGVHGNPHEHEDIKVVVVPADAFVARAQRGELDDMKTVLAAWWLAKYRSQRGRELPPEVDTSLDGALGMAVRLPPRYEQVRRASDGLQFTMNSDVLTGSLLRTLAASKPGGSILELGTGCGLGTSWLIDGMDGTSRLVSVDNDERVQAVARAAFGDDARVTFQPEDGGAFLERCRERFDLIYADAWPGKFSHLDAALDLLAPGGLYVVDDLLPQPNWPPNHQSNVTALLARLTNLGGFDWTMFGWSTGVGMLTRKQATVTSSS